MFHTSRNGDLVAAAEDALDHTIRRLSQGNSQAQAVFRVLKRGIRSAECGVRSAEAPSASISSAVATLVAIMQNASWGVRMLIACQGRPRPNRLFPVTFRASATITTMNERN